MPGRILKFEELSSPEITALDRDKTAFFVPISPLEGHGPHLPIGVDYFDAIYFADTISEITLRQNPLFDAVIMPPIPLGAQVYRQPGSVRVKTATIYDIVKGIGISLASWGFRYIFVLSGHGAPKQIVALESACMKISRKYKIQMHSITGNIAIRFLRGEFMEQILARMGKSLDEETKILLRHDLHGGWWETSMMLLLRPELVKDSYKSLPTVERLKNLANPKDGYFGSPALASREFADISVKIMAEEAAKILNDCLNDGDVFAQTISPLYRIYPLRPHFMRWAISAIIMIAIILGLLLWLKLK